MADIIVVDLNQVNQVLIASYKTPFNLTSYDDGTVLELANGRSEEVISSLYFVDAGDVPVDTSPAVGDGIYYVHILEDGDGTASAVLNSNAGTYRPDLGGYYYDHGGGNLGKVIHRVEKVGSSFNDRVLINQTPRILTKEVVRAEEGGFSEIKGLTLSGIPELTNGVAFPGNNIIDISEEFTGQLVSTGSAPEVNLPAGFTYDNTYILTAMSRTVGGAASWHSADRAGSSTASVINIVIETNNKFGVANNDPSNTRDYKIIFARFS